MIGWECLYSIPYRRRMIARLRLHTVCVRHRSGKLRDSSRWRFIFSECLCVHRGIAHSGEWTKRIGQVYAFRVRSLYGINPDWLLLRCTLPFCIKFAFFFPGTTMAEQLRVVFCYTETLLFFKVYTSRQKSATVAWLVELNTGRLAVWVPLSPVHTVVPLCKTLTTKMQQNQNKTI